MWVNPLFVGVLSGCWRSFSKIVEDDTYELTYVIDGQFYKKYEIEPGSTVTPEAAPEKAGYVFSGWQTVPSVMPEEDVIVYGSFIPAAANGIETVTAPERVTDDRWYTLNGLRLNVWPTQKGLYLHQGRKVVVR